MVVSWRSPVSDMPDFITKSDWLIAQQCIGMAWHDLRAEPVPPNEAERFRMQQGQEVGALARTLYSNGLLVSGRDNHASAAKTRALMADQARETIFEATALAAPFVAKADILTRIAGGWHLLEVKSSFSDTKDLAGLWTLLTL
jgi:hypothetical protein